MPVHEAGVSAAGGGSGGLAAPVPEVTWPGAMLEADPVAAAGAFDRAIGGLARRLPAVDAARFLMALDSALYSRLGGAAIAAEAAREGGEAVHPKHRLTKYHDFFVHRVGRGERVADLGCGLGMLATAMATRAGAAVTGVDMNAGNVEAARGYGAGRGARVKYVVGDIMDVARGVRPAGMDERFDTVVLSNVLEHLKDRPVVVRGVMATLGAKRLLLRVPSFERDWRVPVKRELGVEWRLDPTHEVEHTREELMAELKGAGVRVAEFEARWGEFFVVGRV